jgi:hypothetical protein
MFLLMLKRQRLEGVGVINDRYNPPKTRGLYK